MEYEIIKELDREQIDDAITRNEPDELLTAVLSATLYSRDPLWAESVCLRLADHEDFTVRGNAILGFAHIARIHGKLDADRVKPTLESALSDESEYVRGQAEGAADDIEHYLKWRLHRPRNPEA